MLVTLRSLRVKSFVWPLNHLGLMASDCIVYSKWFECGGNM